MKNGFISKYFFELLKTFRAINSSKINLIVPLWRKTGVFG